jgi:hypothetical protein
MPANAWNLIYLLVALIVIFGLLKFFFQLI